MLVAVVAAVASRGLIRAGQQTTARERDTAESPVREENSPSIPVRSGGDSPLGSGLIPSVNPTLALQIATLKDIGVAIALLSVPLFALRALRVSNFQIGVAFALVQYTTPATFVSAVFVDMAPTLLSVYAIYLAYTLGKKWNAEREDRWLRTLLGATVCVALMVPGALGADTFFLIPAAFCLFSAFTSGVDHKIFSKYNRLQIAGLGFFLVLGAVSRPLWLPPENFTTKTGVQTVYFLQGQDSDLIVYDPLQAAVKRIAKADVVSRQFCGGGPTGTVASTFMRQQSGLPACSETR